MAKKKRIEIFLGDKAKRNNFIMISRKVRAHVLEGQLSPFDLLVAVWTGILFEYGCNECVTNYCKIADGLEKLADADKIRQSLKRLKKSKIINFKTRQGEKYTPFYISNLYPAKTKKSSEVKTSSPKFKERLIPSGAGRCDNPVPLISEVPTDQKEKRGRDEIKEEIRRHPLFSRFSEAQWQEIFSSFPLDFLIRKLTKWIKAPKKAEFSFSFDGLMKLLREDWQKAKPARSYNRDNEEFAANQKKWAEQGSCPPPKDFLDLKDRLKQESRLSSPDSPNLSSSAPTSTTAIPKGEKKNE